MCYRTWRDTLVSLSRPDVDSSLVAKPLAVTSGWLLRIRREVGQVRCAF